MSLPIRRAIQLSVPPNWPGQRQRYITGKKWPSIVSAALADAACARAYSHHISPPMHVCHHGINTANTLPASKGPPLLQAVQPGVPAAEHRHLLLLLLPSLASLLPPAAAAAPLPFLLLLLCSAACSSCSRTFQEMPLWDGSGENGAGPEPPVHACNIRYITCYNHQ